MPQFFCLHCGQRIDADDSLSGKTTTCPSCNGEIVVPATKAIATTTATTPETPPAFEEALPPVTIKCILWSGRGIFLAIAGVISVALDLASPTITTSTGDSIPLFQGGSFTLGWIFIVAMIITPAALARYMGVAPLNRLLAFGWCFLAFFGWMIIQQVGADPHRQPRPNLAFIGGLILCWRLLTWKDEE